MFSQDSATVPQNGIPLKRFLVNLLAHHGVIPANHVDETAVSRDYLAINGVISS